MKSTGLGIGFRVRVPRMDQEKILRREERRTIRFLNRFGAFVRTRAMSSIRSAGKSGIVSDPGEPPRSHNGFLKRNIWFKSTRKSVVIGPVIVATKFGGPKALNALEEGGSVMARVVRKVGGGRNSKGQFQEQRILVGERQRMRVEARPFMGPAFHSEQANISSIWRTV